jgi:hypothetical protein
LLKIETEVKTNKELKVEGIRFIFNPIIFQLQLSYKWLGSEINYATGDWLMNDVKEIFVDQIVFELKGSDASLFILKKYVVEKEQNIKLRLIWK